MYWKEIPLQVQAVDGRKQISRPLDPRFQQGVDAIAMFDGSAGEDAYLESYAWGPYLEVPGEDPARAADEMTARINERFPRDFVSRIRDLQKAGTRNPAAGAVDHWYEDSK